jgi:hypothetical protein
MNEDFDLNIAYGEDIEKTEKGESVSFEINDADELFKKL